MSLRVCKALDKQLWAGANIRKCVSDQLLAKVISQVKYNASAVAAPCGLAGGADLPSSVMPFILRNIRLQGWIRSSAR